METFKYLASLYDIDTSLPVIDRINLYAKLVKEPLVKNDVMVSIKQLANDLKTAREYTLLNYLYKSCGVVTIMPKSLFYDDAHNVHGIASESKEVAERIIARWPAKYSRCIDHPFIHEVERMDLTELFASVFRFIQESKHKKDLMKRLYEEMDEGQGTCTTGHICRLVNVIRGYVNTNFETRMPHHDHDRSMVFHILNTTVDMIDTDRILENIKKVVKASRKNEFKDISDHNLIKYLCDYTKESQEIIIELLK